MRNLVLALALTFISFSAYADNNCSDTIYKMPDDTFKFGMSLKQATASANRAFKGKGSVIERDVNVIVVLNNHPLFDQIIAVTREGKVTRLLWSYSPSFQRKFGGVVEALKIMYAKLKDKYGVHNHADTSDGSVSWGRNGGASLTVMVEEPSDLNIRMVCDDLEDHLRKEMEKKANFGF